MVEAITIQRQVDAVRRQVEAICRDVGRDPATVRLIAVTKEQDPGVIPALVAAGIQDLGENRCEHHAFMQRAAPPGVRFHAIGRIQGRQLPRLVPITQVLHALADPDHVPRLARAVIQQGREPFQVFAQVNVSGEPQKAGVVPDALPELLAEIRRHPALDLVGLMTMAPEGADDATLHRCFSRTRDLADRHGLPRRSMGMSQDFPIAVACGATDIRIGTRLFTPC